MRWLVIVLVVLVAIVDFVSRFVPGYTRSIGQYLRGLQHAAGPQPAGGGR